MYILPSSAIIVPFSLIVIFIYVYCSTFIATLLRPITYPVCFHEPINLHLYPPSLISVYPLTPNTEHFRLVFLQHFPLTFTLCQSLCVQVFFTLLFIIVPKLSCYFRFKHFCYISFFFVVPFIIGLEMLSFFAHVIPVCKHLPKVTKQTKFIYFSENPIFHRFLLFLKVFMFSL